MKNTYPFHRHSIRLRGQSYTEGIYFITLCIQHHECLLGSIFNGVINPNDANKMFCKWWRKIPEKFPDILLDEYVFMPNHFHAILINTGHVGADPRVCPDPTICISENGSIDNSIHENTQTFGNDGEHMGSPLYSVVQWFKTMTTNDYIRNVKTNNWPAFPGKLWQRNYFEHIIRHESDYQRIKKYITDNPINWNK